MINKKDIKILEVISEYDIFHKEEEVALSKLITLAKAFDSVDMLKERKAERDGQGYLECNADGFNEALDLCKPLIVKRDMRIAELEEDVNREKENYEIQKVLYSKLQQQLQAMKDKMSEEEILKIINGSALAATAGVWWFESPNEDSIQEERFEIERIDLAKAIIGNLNEKL